MRRIASVELGDRVRSVLQVYDRFPGRLRRMVTEPRDQVLWLTTKEAGGKHAVDLVLDAALELDRRWRRRGTTAERFGNVRFEEGDVEHVVNAHI